MKCRKRSLAEARLYHFLISYSLFILNFIYKLKSPQAVLPGCSIFIQHFLKISNIKFQVLFHMPSLNIQYVIERRETEDEMSYREVVSSLLYSVKIWH